MILSIAHHLDILRTRFIIGKAFIDVNIQSMLIDNDIFDIFGRPSI